MSSHVEAEFAVDTSGLKNGGTTDFVVLQVRPVVLHEESEELGLL